MLSGGRCPACGACAYPRRHACRLDGTPLEAHELSGRGTLQAFTTIRVAPAGFEPPYLLGFVVLEEGPRVLVQLPELTAETARAGLPVVVRAEPIPGAEPAGDADRFDHAAHRLVAVAAATQEVAR